MFIVIFQTVFLSSYGAIIYIFWVKSFLTQFMSPDKIQLTVELKEYEITK